MGAHCYKNMNSYSEIKLENEEDEIENIDEIVIKSEIVESGSLTKVKCRNCNNKILKRNLTEHVARCTIPKYKKVHICNTCGYEARSPSHLEAHQRKHNKAAKGPKIYQCEHCLHYKSLIHSNFQRHLKSCKEKAPQILLFL